MPQRYATLHGGCWEDQEEKGTPLPTSKVDQSSMARLQRFLVLHAMGDTESRVH